MKSLLLITSLLALCLAAHGQRNQKNDRSARSEIKRQGFTDVLAILGKPSKDLISYFGDGDHFPSNPKYTRQVGKYEFFTGKVATRYKGRINSIIIRLTDKIQFSNESVLSEALFSRLGIKLSPVCKIDTLTNSEVISLYIEHCFPTENAQADEDDSGFYYAISFNSSDKNDYDQVFLNSAVIRLLHEREIPKSKLKSGAISGF